MASTDDVLAIAGLIFVLKSNRNKKRRIMWCKDMLRERQRESDINLLNELKFTPEDWHNFLRMNEETYLKLLALVSPIIAKKDTLMRSAITPHERLTATLKFLASGKTYEELKLSTGISPQALGNIIPETCDAIYKVLHKRFLKFPRTEQDWKNIAEMFETKWNFPHCLGVIDGRHVDIIPPSGSGSFYYNYKRRFSTVLVVIVDARYQFIMCDFGTNGRISDGSVLYNTKFFEKLENKLLKIPSEEYITGTSTILPYLFVGDDAFPLRRDLMKSYQQDNLDSTDKKIYNYRVSRAKRLVKNTFGILSSRFGIFNTQINLHPKRVDKIVMACCVLHNFLMMQSASSYAPSDCFDYDDIKDGTQTLGLDSTGSNMEPLDSRIPENNTNNAESIRERFINYFINEGKVSWQDKFIH